MASTRSLGRLTLDLVARVGGFTGPMDKASRRTKKQMSDMGRQVEAAANKISLLSVAAASAAATGIAAMTRAGIENIDQQAKLARQLDSTIGGLRGLQLAANDAGIETGVINSAMERFSARLGEAQRGTGQAADALSRLSLDARELASTDVDDRVAKIADRVHELGLSGAETADVLRQFGIRNREIVNLLRQGGDAIRDARQEVEDYGLAINAVDAAAVEAANDAMSRAGLLVESVRNSLAIELAPIILEIANRFNESAREAGGLGQAVHESVRTSIEVVAHLADSFAHVNRIIHVAGVGTREFGLTIVKAMYDASRAIMEGPVNALNHMIEAMNKLPGIDVGFIDQPEMVYQAREQVESLEKAISDARREIEDTLAADLPSVSIFSFLDDVDRRMEEMRQNIGDGPGLGELLFDHDDERALAKGEQEIKKLEDSYQSLLDKLYPLEASQRQFREELALLDLAAQAGAVNDLADAQDRLGESYRNATDWAQEYGFEGKAAMEKVEKASVDFGFTFNSSFEDAILQTGKLSDAIQGLTDDFIRMMLRAGITKPLGDAVGGWMSGILPFADGGAFNGGRVQAFASGGVVNGPTLFPMANGTGLMGEAGPEAIMPLTRGPGGKLGVEAYGSPRVDRAVAQVQAPQFSVNITPPDGFQARTEQRENASGGRDLFVQFDEMGAQAINTPGSKMGRALQQRFGANRTLTGR